MPADGQASALPSALLLAATGGALDAIVYLNHGHVFANAMTGNVIFLGISAVTRDWAMILPHLTPIVAYLAGVCAARLMKARPLHHLARAALLLEMAALALCGALPRGFPQAAFVAMIAVVSAFQVTIFRHVGRFTYNSTFVTGNLRDMVEGAWDHVLERDPAKRWFGREKFVRLGLVCAAFLAGAIYGASVAAHDRAHDVWFVEPMLVATAFVIWRQPGTWVRLASGVTVDGRHRLALSHAMTTRSVSVEIAGPPFAWMQELPCGQAPAEQDSMNRVTSSATAEHYTWGQDCDGWHLVRTPALSVIEERMPPGTSERRHVHRRAQQFFYVLTGSLTLDVEGTVHVLQARQGLAIEPGQAHQARNESGEDVRFLVTSQPPSRGDRVET